MVFAVGQSAKKKNRLDMAQHLTLPVFGHRPRDGKPWVYDEKGVVIRIPSPSKFEKLANRLVFAAQCCKATIILRVTPFKKKKERKKKTRLEVLLGFRLHLLDTRRMDGNSWGGKGHGSRH